MNKAFDFIKYVFGQFGGFLDVLDILLVAGLIFVVIWYIRERRATKIATGIVLLLVVFGISALLDMRGLKFVFSNIFQVGILALIILFQPELRSGLEKVGGNPIRKIMGESKSSTTSHDAINNICLAVSELSQEYTGALIVIERYTMLGDIIKTGSIVNSDASIPLIKNIFYNKAPLHDGAMIIRGGRVHAAGCILPLSSNDDIISNLGTRHRAAIGMSENSDAVIIVVSEETGTISLAVDGQLKRNFDYNSLRKELSTLLGENSKKNN